MNIIKRGLLGTAVAMTVGMAAMGSAYANTSASSILLIENFRLLKANGSAFTAADFTNLSGTNDAHATALLNGVGPAPASDSTPINLPPTSLPQRCAFACPVGDNVFTPPPAGGWVGTFGYADEQLTGSLLGAGANARTRADAATNANFNIASGNSDVGTSTTFRFSVNANQTVTLDFLASAFTDAVVTGASGPTSNANARLSWSVNIVDLSNNSVAYAFAPTELNGDSLRSATDTNPGSGPYSFIHAYGVGDAGTTASLLGNRLYQFTLQHNTLANVLQQEEVPEPATLAIVAAGLLSMSLVSRRRKS
jgi:hypothetical protein